MQEILQEIRSIRADRKGLRSFGMVMCGALLVIAFIGVWISDWTIPPTAQLLAGIGAGFLLIGLVAPMLLKPIYFMWMTLAAVLGFIMTRVILSIVYYVVLTPIGLLLRLFGKDLLNRKIEPEASTYWLSKTYHDESPARMEKYY